MRAWGIGLRLDGAVEDDPQIMFRQSTKRKIDDLHHERSDDSESSENYPLLDDHEVDDDTSSPIEMHSPPELARRSTFSHGQPFIAHGREWIIYSNHDEISGEGYDHLPSFREPREFQCIEVDSTPFDYLMRCFPNQQWQSILNARMCPSEASGAT